jgi:beta-lactamase regulating signal transducer with metallopeptidase domain
MAIAWALGTGVILLYLVVGFLATWWLRRSASRVDAPWVDDARGLAEAYGVRGRIECVESSAARTPMVCGLWRPLIVMPRNAEPWPVDRLRAVLLHELAHITRRDCLTQALAQVVCAVYWVNPLVWVAARRLRVERERACDDFVLTAGTKGSDYARHLLDIAQATRPRWSRFAATGIAMAHRLQLEERLSAVLDPSLERSSAFSARLGTCVAVVMLCGPVAAVQLHVAATPATAAAVDAPFSRRPLVPVLTPSPDRVLSVTCTGRTIEKSRRSVVALVSSFRRSAMGPRPRRP